MTKFASPDELLLKKLWQDGEENCTADDSGGAEGGRLWRGHGYGKSLTDNLAGTSGEDNCRLHGGRLWRGLARDSGGDGTS